MTSLFRKQILSNREQHLHGDVDLSQPFSFSLYTVVVLLLFGAMVLLFIFGEFTRRETVSGYINPDTGVINQLSYQVGVVENIWVREGEHIKKDQHLLSVVMHRTDAYGEDHNEVKIQELEKSLEVLTEQGEELEREEKRKRDYLESKVLTLRKKLQLAGKQKELLDSKKKLVIEQGKKLEELYDDDYLPIIQVQEHEQKLIAVREQIAMLEKNQLELQEQSQEVHYEIDSLASVYQEKHREIRKQRIATQSQLSLARSNYKGVVKASVNGTVASINTHVGEALRESKNLLTIIPEGAAMEAVMFVPTKAIAFIKKGQAVRIKLDAYPYQKYGYLKGRILSIDNTVVDSAVASYFDASKVASVREPVYRVKVALGDRENSAASVNIQLKSGMRFKAELPLETRTLFEWLIEPLTEFRESLAS